MKEIRTLFASEIEVRVNQIDKSNVKPKWCSLLIYKDARVDYNLLDEVYGSMNWQCEYNEVKEGLFCTIKIWNDGIGDWISKSNVGTPNPNEPAKSEASDAFKRAAVACGIGRELYSAPAIFINLNADDLSPSNKMKQTFHVSEIGYDESRRINLLVIKDSAGRVRYSLGSPKSVERVTKPQPTAKVSTGDADVDDKLSKAVAQINAATTITALQTIYSEWVDLQSNAQFLSTLTNRKNKLKASNK